MTSITAVARRVSCIAVALALPGVATAQSSTSTSPLPTPRALKQAYAKGTRSPDGRPGPKYWENHGRYTISLTTSPPNRNVTGTEQIVYVNNSPDTLKRLAMRIIANVHKPGAYRETNASPDYLTSGVHIDRFTVNGQPATWNAEKGFTVQGVTLPAPLMPHDSVRLGVDWHYDMSKESGREGAIDSTTFFLAYAYPRVSVYDDVNGWDLAPFNERLEFYSDFNDYDVTVKVPANYVVWGTGTLRNASEVLQPEIFKRYQASLTSPTTVRVATLDDMRAKRVTAQQPMNAWHFTATNVPDVAFAASDHYVWDATSVSVAEGRPRASAQAAYNDTASDYHNVARYAAHALDWLSHEWPGVPYPYEKTTVVQGFAGMEYPMMANDESYPDTLFSRFVAEHEIAHSYFPFYMGIDETRYPFMDEGMTTATEYLLNVANLGKAKADSFFKAFRVTGWVEDPSAASDEPIITPMATGNNGYGKPALGYLALKELLGDARYRKALHEYMDEWHGKHPSPWDYFNTFNRASGENLDWFWRSWFFEPNYIDIGITGVKPSGDSAQVTLTNVGGMPAPFDLVVRYNDGTSLTLHQTPAIWRTNLRTATVTIPMRTKGYALQLEHGIWMDADTRNDSAVAMDTSGPRAK